MNFDITVVGAGVVGTAIARALSKYELSVALVDAANDVGQGTSKANTAILHTGFDAEPGTLESRLVRRGYDLLRDYAHRTGIPVERTGAILVAWSDEELANLPSLQAKARANGTTGLESCPPRRFAALPTLGPGALVGWTSRRVDHLSVDAVDRVRDRSGRRRCRPPAQSPVQSVDVGRDKTTLRTDRGDITTRWLVNAAGLGSDTLDRELGHDRFTVTPRRVNCWSSTSSPAIS